jgi:hypothetical protein
MEERVYSSLFEFKSWRVRERAPRSERYERGTVCTSRNTTHHPPRDHRAQLTTTLHYESALHSHRMRRKSRSRACVCVCVCVRWPLQNTPSARVANSQAGGGTTTFGQARRDETRRGEMKLAPTEGLGPDLGAFARVRGSGGEHSEEQQLEGGGEQAQEVGYHHVDVTGN